MADKSEDTFRTILGIKRGTTASTVSDVIGGALMSVGLLGAINEYSKMKSYEDITKGTRKSIDTVYNDFTNSLSETQAGFEASLTSNTESMASQIKADVLARGMDSKVGETSASQFKSSTSGAYAAARAALSAAKFSAQSTMDKAKVGYYTQAAEMNFKSALAKKASEMGLWGALGGTVVAGTKAALKRGPAGTGSLSETSIEDVGPTETIETPSTYANPDQKAEEEA